MAEAGEAGWRLDPALYPEGIGGAVVEGARPDPAFLEEWLAGLEAGTWPLRDDVRSDVRRALSRWRRTGSLEPLTVTLVGKLVGSWARVRGPAAVRLPEAAERLAREMLAWDDGDLVALLGLGRQRRRGGGHAPYAPEARRILRRVAAGVPLTGDQFLRWATVLRRCGGRLGLRFEQQLAPGPSRPQGGARLEQLRLPGTGESAGVPEGAGRAAAGGARGRREEEALWRDVVMAWRAASPEGRRMIAQAALTIAHIRREP